MTNIPHLPLNEKAVNDHLSWPGHPFAFHFYQSIDSTNQFLRDLPATKKIDVCCSESQTAGRGRFGRAWYSPFGENLYCSSRWQIKRDLSGLSLVVSLALIETIKAFLPRTDIKIKWPNDILWEDKKLCGTLIEIIPQRSEVIIGIGLNVNSIISEHSALEKPWSSLYEIGKKQLDRNHLLACMLSQLYQHLHLFQDKGFAAFLNQWEEVDYLKAKALSVFLPGKTLEGQAIGMTEKGELIVKDLYGEIHFLQAGETSLRQIETPT